MIGKLEGQLKQEKIKNRENQTHIKRLQADIAALGEEPGNVQLSKKLLDVKGNTIHMLKKKLKVPSTQHVQTLELTALRQ